MANVVLGVLATLIGATTLVVSWMAWRLGYLGHLIVVEVVGVALGSRALARRARARPLRGAS
jgi:hypothetical protein